MNVEFTNQHIDIAVGPHWGEVRPQIRTVDAIVGVGTDLACYAVPDGTALGQKFPEVWLVNGRNPGLIAGSGIYHHCIPTNPLPANAETAKLLLYELHNKQIRIQSDAQKIILAMEAAGIGHWVWISPARETEY